MDAIGENAATTTAGFDAARAFRWGALATAGLVLVQAILAGRGWFKNDLDLIDVHGVIGNVTFLAAIGLAVLAFLGRQRGAMGGLNLGLSVLLVVLVTAQLGLGYSGRDSADAAAWHIPNGVLIFGLTTVLLTLSLTRHDAGGPAAITSANEEAAYPPRRS